MCVQLTNNVDDSTSGAVQRFTSSCRRGILRASSRRDSEAMDAIREVLRRNDSDDISVNPRDLFELPTGIEALDRINCPTCLGRRGIQTECCGNGQCLNGTCQCYPGYIPSLTDMCLIVSKIQAYLFTRAVRDFVHKANSVDVFGKLSDIR